jgi:hypothetical protein
MIIAGNYHRENGIPNREWPSCSKGPDFSSGNCNSADRYARISAIEEGDGYKISLHGMRRLS